MPLQKFITISFCFFICGQLFSQEVQKIPLARINKDSLLNIYGNNKQFIPGMELPALVALSFYPELVNTRITFLEADKESIGKTTISFFSILHSADKHFIIYINNNKRTTGFILRETSFKAQVGAFGHELAHVADFNKKTFAGMAIWGIRYLGKKSMKSIERDTDISTIEHGLGMELYEFVDYALNHSAANDTYKKFKKRNYLSPAEILQRVQERDKLQKKY